MMRPRARLWGDRRGNRRDIGKAMHKVLEAPRFICLPSDTRVSEPLITRKRNTVYLCLGERPGVEISNLTRAYEHNRKPVPVIIDTWIEPHPNHPASTNSSKWGRVQIVDPMRIP